MEEKKNIKKIVRPLIPLGELTTLNEAKEGVAEKVIRGEKKGNSSFEFKLGCICCQNPNFKYTDPRLCHKVPYCKRMQEK